MILWLGANEAKKWRHLNCFRNNVNYAALNDGLTMFVSRLVFENTYRKQLRELAQTGLKSMAFTPSARRTFYRMNIQNVYKSAA